MELKLRLVFEVSKVLWKNLASCLAATWGRLLLFQTDNLSKTIQKSETSAVEAQSLAKSLLSVLVSDPSDESFQFF